MPMPVAQIRFDDSCSVTLFATRVVALATMLSIALTPELFSSPPLLLPLPAVPSPPQQPLTTALAARLPFPASITVTASMPTLTSTHAMT